MNKKVFKPEILIIGVVISIVAIALWLFGINSSYDSIATAYDKAMLRAFSGILLMIGSAILLVRSLLQIKLQKGGNQNKDHCISCGDAVQDSDNFCQTCGNRL
jgi:hypothetical protein